MNNTFRSNSFYSAFSLPHFFILLLYGIAVVFLFEDFGYIAYKDEISYIAIAEKYAAGDLLTAVNALWGPLLTRLLAVPITLGLSSDVAAKLLAIGIGVFAFFSARTLSYTFEMSEKLRSFLLLLLVPILVYCSLIFFTPDLLLAGLLIFYFSSILNRKYASLSSAGLICGVLGAFAYFAKGYAFYFFLLHFLLLNFLHYVISVEKFNKKIVLRNCLTGLTVFLILAAAWVYMLNLKYGEITLGVTGRYNHAIKGPESKGRPLLQIGFVPPPTATATSIWEDPYYFYEQNDALACCLKPWSPLDSLSSFKHQTKLILKNLWEGDSIFFSFSILSLTIIITGILLCIVPGRSLSLFFRWQPDY